MAMSVGGLRRRDPPMPAGGVSLAYL